MGGEGEETLECPDIENEDSISLASCNKWKSSCVYYIVVCVATAGHIMASLENFLSLARGKCRETACAVYPMFRGCCLIIEGKCANGHTINTHKSKSYTDNLDFASAIILSGNNFYKMKLLSFLRPSLHFQNNLPWIPGIVYLPYNWQVLQITAGQ